MSKILIGVATAALWFALSHVANAEQGATTDQPCPSAWTSPIPM